MAMSEFKVDVSVRHIWFIKLINIPLVTFGFKPYVPKFCMVVSKPYSSEVIGP
ncbi:MAG: hypothetical protein Tp118SUR00d2C21406351_33 [Prokaryotic dsDNA virus sp.]|nr:MAG: hypothetical protein Tp118SUR00d2C21406351_33 [Prokaryotic dsDNA virus sp.]